MKKAIFISLLILMSFVLVQSKEVRENILWFGNGTGGGGGITDHGILSGLGDDDHTQYVLTTGARNVTGYNFDDWLERTGDDIIGNVSLINSIDLNISEDASISIVEQNAGTDSRGGRIDFAEGLALLYYSNKGIVASDGLRIDSSEDIVIDTTKLIIEDIIRLIDEKKIQYGTGSAGSGDVEEYYEASTSRIIIQKIAGFGRLFNTFEIRDANINFTENIMIGGCIRYNCSGIGGCVTLGTCV